MYYANCMNLLQLPDCEIYFTPPLSLPGCSPIPATAHNLDSSVYNLATKFPGFSGFSLVDILSVTVDTPVMDWRSA